MSLAHTVLDVFADQQAVKMLSWVTLVFIILVVVVFTGFYALMYRRTDDSYEERACRDRRSRKSRKCSHRRTSSACADKSPGDGLHGETFVGHTSFACPPSSTLSDDVRLDNENGPSNGTASACRNKPPRSSETEI